MRNRLSLQELKNSIIIRLEVLCGEFSKDAYGIQTTPWSLC